MFRFFLKKKIFSAENQTVDEEAKNSRARLQDEVKNRRLIERFPIDHKHLTLMNDQDILLIRELSGRGFCAQVSDRGFQRMEIGDIYEGRIRYLGEIFDLCAKVAWKLNGFVGFEIVSAPSDTQAFIKRLLGPIALAASLNEVDATFVNQDDGKKYWFHSESGADLFIWKSETDGITAWELTVDRMFVEWSRDGGFTSGSVGEQDLGSVLGLASNHGRNKDPFVDGQKRRFALDVLMALPLPIREELLDTVTEMSA